ncbi:DUF3889 domain-containing protein [Bacillus sp. BGMRC 2118]|nr:DUF3889 domain-containing protein [Bacillus sp. BGMRC 2118]
MKTIISTSLVLSLFILEGSILTHPFIVEAQQEVPSYAKWGKLAVERTKEKYPNAKVIDYLHIGREKGTVTYTEKFKLWLKEESKEFGVYVDITIDNKTEKLVAINFEETAR